MPKVKNTKVELKAQMDALKRFQRFLPMLLLKKQQLQVEVATILAQVEELHGRELARIEGMSGWVALFADEQLPDDLVVVDRVVTEAGNIAGVPIPLFRKLETHTKALDLFMTPSWYDEASASVADLLALRAEAAVLEEQRRRIVDELRSTSQRVNLFEKVKIPECRENIRIIRIALGDEQTAGVARGKIAKRRSEREADDEEEAAA